jgi:hypothetical protein
MEVANFVGLLKDLTTERTKVTEKKLLKNLCGLRDLCLHCAQAHVW